MFKLFRKSELKPAFEKTQRVTDAGGTEGTVARRGNRTLANNRSHARRNFDLPPPNVSIPSSATHLQTVASQLTLVARTVVKVQ